MEISEPQNAAIDPEITELPAQAAEFVRSLPKARGWRRPFLYKYQNFWCPPREIYVIMNLQAHFKAQKSDIFIATVPKSGTTWLKAVVYATMTRTQFQIGSDSHPLMFSNPHDLVPFLEFQLYANGNIPDLSGFGSPRIFATHVPYLSLPDSVKMNSDVKIVYLCRNPLDTFISTWHFINSAQKESFSGFTIEEAFDMFCNGLVLFGPFWDHMLGYWKRSISDPDKVLFLKYEDMKNDAVSVILKLAEFLGVGFSEEELKEIENLCSFENFKELEANKTGNSILGIENRTFFRKGEVGDWVNHLTPDMSERMCAVMEEKLGGSGLSFSGFGCP